MPDQRKSMKPETDKLARQIQDQILALRGTEHWDRLEANECYQRYYTNLYDFEKDYTWALEDCLHFVSAAQLPIEVSVRRCSNEVN